MQTDTDVEDDDYCTYCGRRVIIIGGTPGSVLDVIVCQHCEKQDTFDLDPSTYAKGWFSSPLEQPDAITARLTRAPERTEAECTTISLLAEHLLKKSRVVDMTPSKWPAHVNRVLDATTEFVSASAHQQYRDSVEERRLQDTTLMRACQQDAHRQRRT